MTPAGFSFCQQCGKPLADATPRSATPPEQGAGPAGKGQAVDPMMPTPQAPLMVGGNVQPAPAPAPQSTPAATPAPAATAWGKLISVNRDGSDGKTHLLSGEFVEIGSGEEVGLRFEDRYLARVHTRLENVGGKARVVLVDRFNGVFRRIRTEEELGDAETILVGRELLRFESVPPDEASAKQLIQHGVAFFGSPSRQPWGRLFQLLPSGGAGDVRHLWGDEVVIGREDGEIVFRDDEFLSRRHVALRSKGGRCVLVDLDSSNGTFLRLKADTVLEPGDSLRIGDQMFRYQGMS
jgi:hypothetical protein